MDNGLAFGIFVLIVYVLAVARVTRLLNRDSILDTPRLAIARAFGDDSTLVYFIGCPWCVGFWLSLLTAALPVWALSLPWWTLPLLALATSHLVGLGAQLDDEAVDIEVVDEPQ